MTDNSFLIHFCILPNVVSIWLYQWFSKWAISKDKCAQQIKEAITLNENLL